MFKSKEEEVLVLLDIYRSSVSLSVLEGKKVKKTMKEDLELFKSSMPKHEIYHSSLNSTLEKIFSEANKILQKNYTKTRRLKVFAFLHGFLSSNHCHNIFVHFNEFKKLGIKEVSNIIDAELAKSDSFKAFTENAYKKGNVYINLLRPEHYDFDNPFGRRAKSLEIVAYQTYLDKDIFNVLSELSKSFFDTEELYFLPPQAFAGYDNSAKILIDLGREFVSYSRFYDKSKMWELKSRKSVNLLIRRVERDLLLSYELALSQINLFLSGKCKSQDCNRISEIMQDFENELKEDIFKLKKQASLSKSILLIKNPGVSNEISNWYLNMLSRNSFYSSKVIKDFNPASYFAKLKRVEVFGDKVFIL